MEHKIEDFIPEHGEKSSLKALHSSDPPDRSEQLSFSLMSPKSNVKKGLRTLLLIMESFVSFLSLFVLNPREGLSFQMQHLSLVLCASHI